MESPGESGLMPVVPQERPLLALALLPLELIVMIYLQLDLTSFNATIRTCRRMYQAFTENRCIIMVHLFHAVVPLGARHLSILANKCPLIPFTDFLKATEFIEKHLRRKQWPEVYLLDDVIEMIKLGKVVDRLTEAFVSRCCRTNRDLYWHIIYTRGITETERERIHRAFYAFEIFRRLLQPVRDISGRDPTVLGDYVSNVGMAFMDHFSAPENAQLACTHDFLDFYVLRTFKEMAIHDVAWGHARIPWGLEIKNPRVQHILSLGLEKIVQFVEGECHMERASAVPEPPREHLYFIRMALEDRSATHHAGQHNHYDIRNFGPETNSGPLNAIAWSQIFGRFPKVPIYRAKDHDKRRWGYVCWDISRINALDLSIAKLRHYPGVTVQKLQREDQLPEAMEASWADRSRLYQLGARGWFDRHDLSQLVFVDLDLDRGGSPEQRAVIWSWRMIVNAVVTIVRNSTAMNRNDV